MSERGVLGSHGDAKKEHFEEPPWDAERDGVPALADIKPVSRGFLWFILGAIPFFIVGLWVIADPLGPRPATFFPAGMGSWLGIFLIMLAAGVLMTGAVYHSAVVHEDGH
jgi:hypothetical protein